MAMKKHLFVAVCISFLALLLLPGLIKNIRAEEGKATPAVENSTKEKTAGEMAEFKKDAKARLDELGKRIDTLETKMKNTGSGARADMKREMTRLKAKRAAAKKEMKKLEAAGKEEWEAAKKKVNDAIDDLKEAYEKVSSKIKSE